MKAKKKIKFSNLVVVATIIMINLFTVATMYISAKGFNVPDSLINCYYIFWGTEILGLSGIKISKVRSNYNSSFGDEDSNE